MPSQRISALERITLANGLNVLLCHDSRLKRCAASVRVAAGSHDAPQAWPGLAHFLEHLFFLGTERFAAEDNLMTFVQRHGGQLNASTRERTTDFFFELPPAVFADGLERLCDMLAHPRMAMADQLREREVLHAEFIAWRGNAEARNQIRQFAPLNPEHPLRGFHAGNRYSLSVPNPAFQQALNDFYQRFYQAGQMTLCLTGPQPLSELAELATTQGALFAAGMRVMQQAPPPLFHGSSVKRPENDPQSSHLMCACEELPAKADEAVAFVCHWMNSTAPGGLVATLIERGLIHALKAEPLYQFGGQLLLGIEFKTSSAKHDCAQVAQLLFSWLTFFKAHAASLREEYRRVQQRRLQVCDVLSLAHHHCRDLPTELSEQGQRALTAMLAQLTPDNLVGAWEMNSATEEPVEWRLPPPNPFLTVASPDRMDITPGALVYSNALPDDGSEAVVTLRWQLPCPQPLLWQMLSDSLQDLIEDARQAGVTLGFSAYGPFWQLRLSGLHEPFAAILEQCLHRLRQPDDKTLARYGQPQSEQALIPIRQLLQRLPDHFLISEPAQDSDDLQTLWTRARWIGLASGLPAERKGALNGALNRVPGTPQMQPSALPANLPGRRWKTETVASSESALLLFCPAPDLSTETEASWRFLAHLVQTPFYQRLRVELQLGYAVFSSLRQIAGTTGLLFGAQSPACDASELIGYFEAFLDGLPALISSADLPTQIRALVAQHELSTLPDAQAAELLWQAHLAGRPADYPQRLQTALSNLDTHSLLNAVRQLRDASAGWLVLANRPLPEACTDRYLNGNGLS